MRMLCDLPLPNGRLLLRGRAGSEGAGLAHPIERVIGIGRIAIDADVIAMAAEFDLPLCRLVAPPAQALEPNP